ncbi:MAG TPA: 2-phospho-L-lactate transferase CofD family protein, partial [Demequinaceae bacterium]
GLDWVARLLRARGTVLPLAAEPLEISASVDVGGETVTVRGQVAVATAPGRISRLWLRPEAPHVPPETLAAIRSADLVALGPGSWYSSVLPHFLVAQVANELVVAGPRCVLSLNIAHLDGETEGTDRVDDVRALQTVAPDFVPAVVIVDEGHADDPGLAALIEDWGSILIVERLLQEGTLDRHDADRFAGAYGRAAAILGRG